MSASQNTTPSHKPPIIRELHSADAQWLEKLHAECFDVMQRWEASLFRSLLVQAPTKGLVLIANYNPVGFLIGRRVVDEGEILTIAIHPDERRKGYAKMLIDAFIEEQKKQGLASVFLEVIITNAGAIALYEKLGFKTVATRPDYYQMPEGSEKKFMDGYVMRKDISTAAA